MIYFFNEYPDTTNLVVVFKILKEQGAIL